MKITGSKTISEVVKEFCPNGGEFSLVIKGDSTVVSGSLKSPACRIGASDLWLAMASCGVISDAIANKVAEIVLARAEGKEPEGQLKEWADRHAQRAEGIAKAALAKLPLVESPQTVRVKGEASLA